MRLASAARFDPPVFLFLFRSTHAVLGIANAPARRRAARKWHMSSEALFTRARMYGCWSAPRNIIAVMRWNWGSLTLTRVLETPICVVCIARKFTAKHVARRACYFVLGVFRG